MTKNQQLNQLFEEWRQSSDIHKWSFVSDGVINEEKFEKQKTKILFVCKEPNQTAATEEEKSSRLWDFRVWWKENLWGGFSICLGNWAFGILNDFPEYESITPEKRLNAIHSVAYMNVKKTGGLGVAVQQDIGSYVNLNKQMIWKEVQIIKPDLIVASIGCRNFADSLFDGAQWRSSGHGIEVLSWGDIPVIDFYHPSSRAAHCMSYALLKLVVQSQGLLRL